MKTTKELDQRINEFPDHLSKLAKLLMKDIENGNLSNTQIEDRIRQEIKELVLEDMNK
ncbi:hypothetical protein SAMN05216389_11545 [Oceanobacillus limi]|uniref:Uncharacterized protein n=1 Tax=Oceanobacillus limi TaxID=930131 RepID=A0A1I0FGP7_9BACI|nr:hypothetical protein [Oceanobacillus limi]SET57385.1 hypothetical protein SAMN05216389_11545 [Oceanobacillus limi]